MALINSDVVPFTGGAYELEQSLRFNDDDSAYLSWTPSSAGNRKTWTFSAWVKRGNLGYQFLISTSDLSSTSLDIRFESGNTLSFGGSGAGRITTDAVFRDVSAWYHIVCVFDTTESTSTDRLKIYVNGVLQSVTGTYPSLNYDGYLNQSVPHNIGVIIGTSGAWFDGYMAEVNFIDGTALDASYFGETGTYGEWKPIEYTGSYGTNGFYLPFKQDYTVEGFSTVTYTGNGSTQYVGGVGFQPDWVWIKSRSITNNHSTYDAVRGTGYRLVTNDTSAESYQTNKLRSFDSDGFTTDGATETNSNGNTFVAWSWDMGDFENSELLTNGDFSTGNTTGWTTELGTYNVVTYGGNYVLDPATNGDSFLTQEVSVTAGTDYIVRANIPSYSSGNVWLYVYDSDYTDYNSRGTNLGGSAQTNDDSYHIKVTPSGSTMTIMVSTNGTQDWYMDNISVRQANEDGSISSLVHSNPTYGQSIVSYTDDGTTSTIGHGLSQAPELIIKKNRDATTNWFVYHKDIGNTNKLKLNEAEASSSTTLWGSTTPTSSVWTNYDNANGQDHIAYCFHSVSGYSKIGSYTGTGATGNTITTGFKPAFVIAKRTDSAISWVMMDNARDPSNPVYHRLNPDTSNSEGTNVDLCDFTDTGFTITTSDGIINASGGSYIYMAFADKREFAYWLDQSGNNNDWTSNNLTESDISVDSPTNNFCTMNSAEPDSCTYSEGNLQVSHAFDQSTRGTMLIPTTGKWYWEVRINSLLTNTAVGLATPEYKMSNNAFVNAEHIVWKQNGYVYDSGTINYGTTYTTGDILGVALNMDSGTLTFYKNGSSAGAVSLNVSISNNQWLPHAVNYSGGSWVGVYNFGQDSSFAGNKTAQGNTDSNGIGDFYYTPPSGYLALCTANLPDPAVIPSEHFNTVLYTGNDTSQSITGVGFQPDFTWLKHRNHPTAHQHNLFDVVRGATKTLHSNSTGAEETLAQMLTSFDSDGFSVGNDNAINDNNINYVSWNWKANGSGVSNTDGSITSTVSANQDAGFSIVSYTGTGANATVGHGLSSSPEMVIVKDRDSGTANWLVYNETAGATKYLSLNQTIAATTYSTVWNDTAPTSSVFTVGTEAGSNKSGDDFIAYCFHSVDGFSKVGSYTGNGSTDGTFVYTGFRPAFVLIKASSFSGSYWCIYDTERETYNVVDSLLFPNDSLAETTNSLYSLDILSNGFKARANNNTHNTSGATYIYIAFAETPFKYSNAR